MVVTAWLAGLRRPVDRSDLRVCGWHHPVAHHAGRSPQSTGLWLSAARTTATPYDLRVSTPEPPQPLPGARLLFTLDQSVAHLDHGSFGATPLQVRRAQRRLLDELDANPARFFGPALAERLAHTRRHLAGFVGADPDACACITDVGVGVAVVLRSLGLRADDEIITTDHGDAAVATMVDQAWQETGARHRIAALALGADRAAVVTAVRAALTARTRLVIVDQVTARTAKLLPVADVVRIVQDHGAAVLVNAGGVPGNVPAKVAAVGADFWVGSLHTWAFAPRPCSLLAVAEPWRGRIRPLVASCRAETGYPAHVESRGLDATSWLAAPAGLFLLRSVGIDTVRAHNAALAAYGQWVVGHALGLDRSDLPGSGGAVELPMRIVPLPPGTADQATSALRLRQRISEELGVEVGVGAWRGRGLLRLSAQIYNRGEEYDQLADRLPALLSRAARC